MVDPTQILNVATIFILAASPSPTDDHVENFAVPLGAYETALECNQAKQWIMEHNFGLSHIWCDSVTVSLPD